MANALAVLAALKSMVKKTAKAVRIIIDGGLAMANLNDIVITASLEDYLEAIFVLNQQNKAVRMTDIAELLAVSKPSVNRAIGTLKEAGLIRHETYGEITLTSAGKARAKSVLTRHNLLKNFLSVTLGVDSDTAEKDACRMEHVMSNESVEKLSNFLESLNKRND